jgi:hypothetical protein
VELGATSWGQSIIMIRQGGGREQGEGAEAEAVVQAHSRWSLAADSEGAEMVGPKSGYKKAG